ncbi:MAG: fatty acid desaturase [Verrucomicrobiota bacterium]|nr:fatty acid desaturase [Verrucomicrobiota bacterium]MDQ6938992.1 fatty acid desaturase [Verrucomicrobiota bacterium]
MNAAGQTDFFHSEIDQPHPERTRAILRAHPEVRQLLGRNPFTAVIMLTVLSIQTAIAFWMGRLGMHYWWLSVLIAFCAGAFMNHCMYVIIHDATHNLVFKRKTWNKIVAISADLPNLVPGAIGFGVYHLQHHAHQGDYDYDADIASRWEARLIGDKAYRKALWLLFFPFFQLTRPPRLKAITMLSRWSFVNLALAVLFDWAIIYFCGWPGLLYLIFSFAFSIGLHPVGARWIQEHYTYDSEQETASYYGPINRVALNVGYHNEHHDFPSIAWNRLPRLRALAPEFYDTLRYHTSWTRLLIDFIFDQRYTLFSRVERIAQGKVDYDRARRDAPPVAKAA